MLVNTFYGYNKTMHKQLLAKMLSNLAIFLGLMAIFALLYVPSLRHYLPSGDDLYLMAAAPHNSQEVLQEFSNFRGQYRPLSHCLLALYRFLLPHLFFLYGLHFLLFVGIFYLFFLQLQRVLPRPAAFIIALTTGLSPIFYYHVFAFASLNNLLLLFFGLGLFFLVKIPQAKNHHFSQSQTLILATLCLVAAVFSKETFFLPFFLYGLILWQQLPRRQFCSAALLVIAGMSGYWYLHLSQFQATPEYQLRFHIGQMISTSLDLLAWLVAYPRGWQYAAADPKMFWTYLLTLGSVILWGSIFWRPNIKSRLFQTLCFFLAFAVSVVQFLFIERALVYYLDGTILLLVFWLCYWQKKQAMLLSLAIAVIFLSQFALYFPQWQRYSFVANANTTLQNFRQRLTENHFRQSSQLCIYDNARGHWAIMDGQAARMLFAYTGKIYSTEENFLPDFCQTADSLILKNNGWDFQVVPFSQTSNH